MHIALDVIILLILLFSVIIGYKRGFVKSLLSTIRFAAALLLALLLASPLSVPLNEKIISPAIYEVANTTLTHFEGGEELLALLDEGSEKIQTTLDLFGVSREDASTYAEKAVESGESENTVREGFLRMITAPAAERISVSIAFSAVFFIVFLLLSILQWALNLVAKLPGLHEINQIFGVLFGLLSGLILICVLVPAFSNIWTILSYKNPAAFSRDVIDRTVLFRFFDRHNLLVSILEKIS